MEKFGFHGQTKQQQQLLIVTEDTQVEGILVQEQEHLNSLIQILHVILKEKFLCNMILFQ